jgi:hypothetical protein
MTSLDELGRIAFKTKMAGAPLDALALIETIQKHFASQVDAVTYFRSVPDLRLAALWKNGRGKDRKQVCATIQWQPRLLAFRAGAFIEPSVWSKLGFEGAKLFTDDPLISYISIPQEGWRQNQHGLLAALDAAKRHMLAGR